MKKHLLFSFCTLLLLLALMVGFVSCGHTHVGDEVEELSQYILDEVDSYLSGEKDIMATYVSVYAYMEYWDGLDIETTKYTVTKDFEAKGMARKIVESLAQQASGEEARKDILRQRNALAEIAGLKQIEE